MNSLLVPTLTVNVGASVAPGTYTVTVTGTEGTATHSTSVAVTVPPPATNDFVEKSSKQYARMVDKMPADAIVREIEEKVAEDKLEQKLMEEGTEKFATPQKALQKLVGEKRTSLAAR